MRVILNKMRVVSSILSFEFMFGDRNLLVIMGVIILVRVVKYDEILIRMLV